jgi:ClpP class serine protease
MIRELSAAKPTLAIVNAVADSAAYLLASQARRIVVAEDGEVGSIGAVIMHIDRSRQVANAGIAITFIQAGAKKTEGNQFEALPDDLRRRLQAKVEATRERFASAVETGRGGRITAAAALATEADTYFGPEALALGLADAVAEPSAAFAAFRAALNGA